MHQVVTDSKGYSMWVCPYCGCPYWNTSAGRKTQLIVWKQHESVCYAARLIDRL
jgi:hypothetical protein